MELTIRQQELIAKHGTLEEFTKAIENAYNNFALTYSEAEESIKDYQKQFEEASKEEIMHKTKPIIQNKYRIRTLYYLASCAQRIAKDLRHDEEIGLACAEIHDELTKRALKLESKIKCKKLE